MILSFAQQLPFLPNQFLVKYKWSLLNFAFFSATSHLALLKDRFLKKMLVEKSHNPSPFFHKTIGSYIFFYSNMKIFSGFKDKRSIEFEVTLHCGLWAKCCQLWPLKIHILDSGTAWWMQWPWDRWLEGWSSNNYFTRMRGLCQVNNHRKLWLINGARLQLEAVCLFPAVAIMWVLSRAYTAPDICRTQLRIQVAVHHAIIQLRLNAVILATTILATILWVLWQLLTSHWRTYYMEVLLGTVV